MPSPPSKHGDSTSAWCSYADSRGVPSGQNRVANGSASSGSDASRESAKIGRDTSDNADPGTNPSPPAKTCPKSCAIRFP